MANFAQVGAGARSESNSQQQGAAFDPFASHQYSRPAEPPAPAPEMPVAETSDVFVTVPQVRQVQMHYAPVTQAAPQQPEAVAVEAPSDMNYGHFAPEDDGYAPYSAAPPRKELGRVAAVLGAVASIALVAGIGFWGYNLIVRDVSGVPVVTAMKGPMRVAPETPGGRLADHQGLAVNAVAANGTAAAPADTLQLAPEPIALTEDDQPTAELLALEPELSADLPSLTLEQPDPSVTTAEILPSAEPEVAGSEPLSAEEQRSQDINALVASLTDDAPALSDIRQTSASAAPAVEAAVAETRAKTISAEVAALRDAPGVKTAPRPQMRPVKFERVTTPVAAPTNVERDIASLSVGTRMAQLGAYESGDIARSEWTRISAQFGDFFVGKQRVVQRAESGGRIFYRLRVVGFDDLADARRFCSALVAGQADCIPVVMR
ncbi:Sporulation related domain protein [Tritonibacter multivorans]|uniref:Sporulation related domain protein n=1 Tax=Tritonibacter multivorans TaxID=928856 RepID=A0A0P1GFU8_9RHOB|nr:SPOR domain-containing protein [Tritonibacter multivorans]MDA7420830.1 SPOR domain-containing protein [Tritonibacter multivorans]CUH80670.1 Sporulation related domain protein [Tritonibacter multivorans]SFC85334.1 Sporulation related domain-containing protein [Tritonibacter multivorans]